MRILTEASGSLVGAWLVGAIQDAGYTAIASDINPRCAARYLADDFIQMPRHDEPDLWKRLLNLLEIHSVDMVIPSLDETLLGWAERDDLLASLGVHVIVSSAAAVRIFGDKWLTYQFFTEHGIPTPQTDLVGKFLLVKPRRGRGSRGNFVRHAPLPPGMVQSEGLVSQELLEGEECTVDVLCDISGEPIYIVPRLRQDVRDGKSCSGVVIRNDEIMRWVKQICRHCFLRGPVNMQCFVHDGSVRFTEINTRIGGGMALGFAATENWIPLLIDNFVQKRPITPGSVAYGTQMARYYAEVFSSLENQ